MTYQPSFARETSTPVAASDLTELGWPTSESADSSRELSHGGVDGPNGRPPRRRVPDDDIVDIGACRTGLVAGGKDGVGDALFASTSSDLAARRLTRRGNMTGPLLALLILE